MSRSASSVEQVVRKRLDFLTHVEGKNPDGSYTIRFEPDPNRYEWRDWQGEKVLYDRLDNDYISQEALRSLASNMGGSPIGYQPSTIRDAREYVRARRKYVRKFLNGKRLAEAHTDSSTSFLKTIESGRLEFAAMSLDLVGSTRLSNMLAPEMYARVMEITLYEVSRVVPRFHGHVLKYTGDGIIAYFPAPSFTIKNDLALDCAITLLYLIHECINPEFRNKDLPPLEVRIGIDAGEAAVCAIGSPDTKQERDIIGNVINLAAKIQGLSGPGGIALGAAAIRALHTNWRRACEVAKLPSDWPYTDADGNPYAVFRLSEGV